VRNINTNLFEEMIDALQFKTIYLDMSTLGAYASELGDAGCQMDGW
jgi:hypothetical protein